MGSNFGIKHYAVRQVNSAMPKRKAMAAAATAATAKTKAESPTHTKWLFKSEPESRMEKGVDVKFGLDDLVAEPEQTAHWDGVRNYLARNHMRSMKVGHTA